MGYGRFTESACSISHRIVAIGGLNLECAESIYRELRSDDGIAMAGGLMEENDPCITAQKIQAIRQKDRGNHDNTSRTQFGMHVLGIFLSIMTQLFLVFYPLFGSFDFSRQRTYYSSYFNLCDHPFRDASSSSGITGIWLYWRCLWAKECAIFNISRHVFRLRMHCIKLLPTAKRLLAPIIFCLGRAMQNFLAAGETMGGAIFLLENSSEKRHDLFSSLYSASTMGGHLLASLGVFLLSHYNFTDPGWRFLYLCGCVTALFGCLIRRSTHTVQSSLKFSRTLTNLKRTLWKYRKPFLCIMITSGFASATYSIALVFMNGFIPLVSTLTKTEVMKINTYLLVLIFVLYHFLAG